MIIKKTPHQIEEMAEAGRLSAKVLREVGARVKPGVSTAELDRIAEMIILMEGGIPALRRIPRQHLRISERPDRSWHPLQFRHSSGGRYPFH